ncbi:MAG TPA: outer membrane beta-barrel protein [Flavobacteriales bacterium]|nr:outer membrane beta-barrel protein [Flavobacteriales bacterium]
MKQLTKFSMGLFGALICTGISAQEFRFGGGYSGSNVREAGEEQWVGRAGYNAGVDVVLGGLWFVRPGAYLEVRNLNYSLAQLNSSGVPTGSNIEYRYTDRSLRVPLLVGRKLLDPADQPAVNAYVFGGPTALFNLSADLSNDELQVETNHTQWYIGGGGGLEFSFLFLEGGYNVAMSDVFKGDAFQTNPKVNLVTLTAGVRLRLAK